MKEGEKEYIKEAISALKMFAALLTTAIFGVAGFIVSHINDIDSKQFIMSFAGLLILFVFLCVVAHLFFKMMNKLRRL